MSRRFPTLLALAALLASAAPAATAQSLDEIVAKHFEAQGGAERLKRVQTMRLTGTMLVGPGMEAPFTLEKKRPGKSRLEFSLGGMTGVRAFDGKGGWQLMPFMGQTQPEALSPDEAKDAEGQADFDGPLMDWKAKGHTLELAGREPVDGADAFKLQLTRKSGQAETYYLDAETFLIVKFTGKRVMRGTEVVGETLLGDYKEVGGLLLPFSRTSGVVGSDRRQAMAFDKIEIDVPIDDARFAMPAAAAAAAPADSAKAAKPKAAAGKGQ